MIGVEASLSQTTLSSEQGGGEASTCSGSCAIVVVMHRPMVLSCCDQNGEAPSKGRRLKRPLIVPLVESDSMHAATPVGYASHNTGNGSTGNNGNDTAAYLLHKCQCRRRQVDRVPGV